MWNDREIEIVLKKRLESDLKELGTQLYAKYILARDILIENILDEIKALEPDLTDHGPEHIANVLDNVYELLGEDIKELNAIEIYCLLICILFHDVGNTYGRDNHNINVEPIYDFVRPGILKDAQEKLIIKQVAKAHCGTASDGSNDTLQDVKEEDQYQSKPIKLREIAAILRFADELAEGKQRISSFMIQNKKIRKNSKIFHHYAEVTQVTINRPQNRIDLSYHINLELTRNKQMKKSSEKYLEDILPFIYKRIIKLDQERRYNKYYTKFLEPFKNTSIVFNIHADGHIMDQDELILNDFIIPGANYQEIESYDDKYKIENVKERINSWISTLQISMKKI